jgi:mannose-6-phosphate isomerase-like protein (cupin superfamily)
MSDPNPLSPLLHALAGLFASENRPGGFETARALLDVAARNVVPDPGAPGPLDALLTDLLSRNEHPLAPLIDAARPWLRWEFSALDGRIPDSIALGMMQAELIGPGAILDHETVNVGLFLQGPGIDYVTRRHRAEETFFVLAGNALWTKDDEPQVLGGPGTQIHHPSMTPHSDCTRESALLAAWRWTGDISVEGYTLTG